MIRERWLLSVLVVAAVAAIETPVEGKVVGAGAHGFQIEIKSEVEGSPQRVYDAIVKGVGRWWESSHTYSGDSKNLYIEAKEKGWFGERLPDGGFVRHLQVAFVQPGVALRLLGGLGPLQQMGVDGALTIKLKQSAEGRTELTLLYNVSGFDPNGLDKIAGPVDRVLSEQVRRLKKYVENPTKAGTTKAGTDKAGTTKAGTGKAGTGKAGTGTPEDSGQDG